MDDAHACSDDGGTYETKVAQIDQVGHEILHYALLGEDLSRVLGELHTGSGNLLVCYQPGVVVVCRYGEDVHGERAHRMEERAIGSLVPWPASFSVTRRKVTVCVTENGVGLEMRLWNW